MMRPVSFSQFGSNDRELYRQYLNTFWAEVQLERDEFQVFGSELQRQWKRSRGDVVGVGLPDRTGRRSAIQRAVSWRPGFGGEFVGQSGTGRAADDVGAEPAGVSVSGRGSEDAGGAGGGSGCDGSVGSGSRGASSTPAGGAGGADGASGSGVEAGDGQRESADSSTGAVRGRWYEKNKARRERDKARKARGREGESGTVKTLVSVRAAHPQLDETWARRKIRENEVAIARLDAQLAKIKKEEADGTAEKRYQVEANLVQGQLDGAFALVPQQRVVSWAKTVTSNGSSSSGGKKSQASIPSVSSGLGSGSATTVSARERQLEKENEALKEQMVTFEETERGKRVEMGNNIDRLIHRHESQVIDLKQQLRYYQVRYG